MGSNTQPVYNSRRRQRRALAAVGALVEKRPRAGHNVSHAQNRTKRVFKPNLQRTKILLDGKLVSVRLDARTIRTLTKAQKVRELTQAKPVAKKAAPKTATATKPTAKKTAPKRTVAAKPIAKKAPAKAKK